MNDNQNSSSTGEQMKDALAEALRSGDFKILNDLVSQTVINTVNEVKKQIAPRMDPGSGSRQNDAQRFSEKEASEPPPFTSNTPKNTPPPFVSGSKHPMPPPFVPVWQQRAQERERQKQQLQEQKQQEIQNQQKTDKLFSLSKFKRIGNVSNVLYQVFGGIGLGITGLVTLIRLFVLLAGDTTLGGWIVNLAFLVFFFGMIRLGIFQRRRLKRAERYLQLCNERCFAEIEGLARATGKSKGFVQKDLQKMLSLGMFPEGHLDATKTCFMLNDAVYRQYLEAENSRKIREQENRKALEQQPDIPEASSSEPTEETELGIMVSEGMEFIRKLRDLNDKIPGEVISAKLFCLENLLKDIFDGVRTHPEQMHQMHKLMNYYLPTTLKLVEAYEEFDHISSPGPDIIKAKAEIENTLDTINQAFRELLNKLFQHAVFDATTDAQVLKTMLAREGLMPEMDFAPASRR